MGKRELRRNKICLWCQEPFKDTSKRLSQKTCSKECARALGVAKRKARGSYQRTEKQNKKMVETMQALRAEGKCKISKEKRKKLSKQLKDRWQSGEMNNVSVETNLKKYGVTHPMKCDSVKKKLKKTFREKYGTEWPTQNEQVKNKIRKTRLEKGLTYNFQNKTMKDWADDLGVSYSYFKQVVNEQGFEVAKNLSLKKTGIESIIENSIKEFYSGKIEYDSSSFKQYRPDFILPEANLIIECDGLAWHCDRVNPNKFYHIDKKKFYKEKGYDALFFRSDEIKNNQSVGIKVRYHSCCL